jgi:tetratricopeptide (TPR) repeat protein
MIVKKGVVVLICIFFQGIIIAQDSTKFFEQGNTYFKQKKYNEALSSFDKAVEISPNHSRAYNNRGVAKRALNDTQGAITDFSRSIEINDKNVSAYKNRGLAYMSINQYREAYNDFSSVLYYNPNDEVVRKNYMLVKGILKNEAPIKDTSSTITIKPSEPILKDSIKVNTQNSAPLENEKHISENRKAVKITAPEKKANEKTVSPIPKEVKKQPSKKAPLQKEIKYVLPEKSTEKIINTYGETTKENTQNQAGIKSKTTQFKEAYIHYSKLIEADSSNVHAYVYRGKLKSELRNYKELEITDNSSYNQKYEDALIIRELLSGEYGAIQDYTKAIEINPAFYEAYYYRALSLYNIKQFNNAIVDFTKALELNTTLTEAYYYRGITKGILNDMSGACVDLIKASEMGYTEADELANECK